MENLKDTFRQIGERISNPFIISFLIAWLACNWKIPIALLFYNVKELEIDGYISFIDVISNTLTRWHLLWLPLFIALGYTFLFPVFNALVYIFTGKIKAEAKKRRNTWTKTSTIPTIEYLELKDNALN